MVIYRIDTSMNDAPYQGIHIFKDNEHVLTFWEDDAPVHDFNASQRQWAVSLVNVLNAIDPVHAVLLVEGFRLAYFPKPHERIKVAGEDLQ